MSRGPLPHKKVYKPRSQDTVARLLDQVGHMNAKLRVLGDLQIRAVALRVEQVPQFVVIQLEVAATHEESHIGRSLDIFKNE